MEKTCSQLLAGTFELPLWNCKLRQRHSEATTVYSGPALVTQDPNGRLRIRVFAEGVNGAEAFAREVRRPFRPGGLVPDSDYFDFQGTDQAGCLWHAHRLSLDLSFGRGAYVQAAPTRFEKIEYDSARTGGLGVTAFLPGPVHLPWNSPSVAVGARFSLDTFNGQTDHFKWSLRKGDSGTWLTLTTTEDVETTFLEFWRALSILTGRHVQPTVVKLFERDRIVTRIITRPTEADSAKLLVPVALNRDDGRHANAFLGSFLTQTLLHHAPRSLGENIHRFWHRVLRARENDIENSSLVLSVAIEGLLKHAQIGRGEIDASFHDEVAEAKRVLKKQPLPQRVRECIFNGLGQALRPTTQGTLRRLVAEGVAHQRHLDAWRDMRNAAAHGESIRLDDSEATQDHLDRYHTCLDLFYRIVLKLVGFSGLHTDYSLPGWPDLPFPPTGDAETQGATENIES